MTEKRYYIGNGDNCTICDSNKGGSDFFNMLTQFQAVDKLNELSEENEKLRRKVNGLKSELTIWKEDANEHIQEINKLFEENKDLKDFIRKISTNNEIILANGTIYKIDKVIK